MSTQQTVRIRSISNISRSEQISPLTHNRYQTINTSQNNPKAHGYSLQSRRQNKLKKKIPTEESIKSLYSQVSSSTHHNNKRTINVKRHLRSISNQIDTKSSKLLPLSNSSHSSRPTDAFLNPYENFIKQMNIVLPSPNEKFEEFMQIAPFNRTTQHLELIEHFLKDYRFFRSHPSELLSQIAKKVKFCSKTELEKKFIVIVESGECFFNKQIYKRGQVISRSEIQSLQTEIKCLPDTRFIVLNRHQYLFLTSCYFEKHKQKYMEFLMNIQIFKMFPTKVFQKLIDSLMIGYFSDEEYLYRFGEESTHLYVVYSGKAVRKVIVEIDKMNKIPILKYSKIVKILSKAYEHKIEFNREDLIGITEVIDHIDTRKQHIKIQGETVVLGLDKNLLQENLDEYIVDRLRKYHLKKYPVTYDQLCEKYEKEQTEKKQQQMRKIDALKDTIGVNSVKKNQKINEIIKKYQENIKSSEIRNLLHCKIQSRPVPRD